MNLVCRVCEADNLSRSAHRQYGLLVKRALIREWRDMVTNRARLVGTALEAFIVGTLFLLLGHVQVCSHTYHLFRCTKLSFYINLSTHSCSAINPQSDATTRLGLLFCVLAFFTFESLAALPTAIFERPVFYMQRGQKYYHTSPYVLSHLIAEVHALPIVPSTVCCLLIVVIHF